MNTGSHTLLFYVLIFISAFALGFYLRPLVLPGVEVPRSGGNQGIDSRGETPVKGDTSLFSQKAYLKVFNPKGGEEFVKGQKMVIEWEGRGPDTVNIFVEQPNIDIRYRIGAVPLDNGFPDESGEVKRGKYVWTVGEKLDYPYGTPAHDRSMRDGSYKVRIIGDAPFKDKETGRILYVTQIDGSSDSLFSISE